MTPERFARIKTLIAEAADIRELRGLRWGFHAQGEDTTDILSALEARRREIGGEWTE